MEEYRFEAVNLSTTLINLLFGALAKKLVNPINNPNQPIVWSFREKNLKTAINQTVRPKLLFGLRIFGCQSGHSIVESLQVQFSSFKQFNKVHQISSPFLFSFHLCPREGGCRVVLCTSYHYYRNVFRGGQICFPAAGKRVRHRRKVTVNRGLPAAGRFARCG